jgi:hypothetical protein
MILKHDKLLINEKIKRNDHCLCFLSTTSKNVLYSHRRTESLSALADEGPRSAGLTWVCPGGMLVPHVAMAGTEGRWVHTVVTNHHIENQQLRSNRRSVKKQS